MPLAATLTGGHRNDVTQLLPLIEGIGAIAGNAVGRASDTDRLVADRSYDHDKYRRELRRRGVTTTWNSFRTASPRPRGNRASRRPDTAPH